MQTKESKSVPNSSDTTQPYCRTPLAAQSSDMTTMFSPDHGLCRSCTDETYYHRSIASGEDVAQDRKIAKKIQELSHEEREKALYDLHGVLDVVEETDALIAQKLEELDMELEKSTNNLSFLIAVNQSIDYVKNLRLAFLRADLFDAKKAAKRMVLFFELKRNVFGESKLTKEITLDDLSERERIALKRGSVQMLPQRDRAGRAIFFRIGLLNLEEDGITQVRLSLFVTMTALRDEEIQKRGVVCVQYSVGLPRFKIESLFSHTAALPGYPIRRVSLHLCYDNPILHPAARWTQFIMCNNDARDVCRFRAHFGSHLECQYALMSFGIMRHFIPVTPNGKLKLKFHHRWLKQLQQVPCKEEDSPSIVAIVPGPMDVVLGRGRHGTNAPGNVRYKLFLLENKKAYDCAGDKGEEINRIMKDLRESGTRFIKREGGGWVEISGDVIKLKIAHAFRNLRADVESSNISRALVKK